ncbi:sperm flagellar protein 1 isoform X2 [Rhinolophus sinicus]|uniref:sperm flagellar protein 1 isoform X2 n=1 Tax=Rhinolophus sinicus TaxID=89399 RepID=UPI0009429AE5|nr:PREDICTED: sperm flagellar protein 1 isoform X2 [Rhinolophus sinicus]
MAGSVEEEALHQLYLWIDNIPLSRPKRNLSRDFSDGVLVAEVIKFYFPKMVEMHNYVPANSLQQKLSNWSHLNRKVLNKLNFSVPEDVMRKIAQCAPGVVELVLIPLRQRLEERQRRRKQGSGSLQVCPRRPEGKVPRTLRERGSSGEAGCQSPGVRRIARRFMATRAWSSRSLKRSKSCWPHRRLCRSYR